MKTIKVLLLIFFCWQTAYSQELKKYQGVYLQGEASYTYYEDAEGRQVLEGKFHYEQKKKIPVVVDGFYRDNLKHGKWVYANKKASLTVDYVDGKMEGTYQYTDIKNPEHNLTLQMANNRIVGQASYHFDDGVTVHGEYNKDGYPEGLWEKEDENGPRLVEREMYKNGLLFELDSESKLTGSALNQDVFDFAYEKLFEAYDSTNHQAIVGNKWYDITERYDLLRIPTYFSQLVSEHFASYGDENQEKFVGGEPFKGVPYVDVEHVKTMIDEDNIQWVGEVYILVEDMPVFPEGNLDEWIAQNLQYPPLALEKGIAGTVYVQFIVERDGTISNIKVVRGIEESLDKEAVRLIEAMPKWEPGVQRGKKVRVSQTLGIPFKLK